MSNAMKGIYLAVSIVVLCSLITFVVIYANSGKDTYDTAAEDVTLQLNTLNETKYSKYAGDDIKGSEVQYCVKNFNDISIKITTNNSVTTGASNNKIITSFTRDDIYDNTKAGVQVYASMTDRTSKYYINPNAVFAGKLIRDDNNVITGLEFRQQNYTNVDKEANPVYEEVPAKLTSSVIENGIYAWSDVLNFLISDVSTSYVNYSVTIRVSGGSYFYSYRTPYDGKLVCDSNTLFLATVNKSLNNSVYIEFVEQTSESASAIALVFEKYRPEEESKYMLVSGDIVCQLLSDYSADSPFKMKLTTYTNRDNSLVTYWNRNPFVTNDPAVMGYVDRDAMYLCRVDGYYDTTNDLRDMEITFTNSNISSSNEYDITDMRDLFIKLVGSDKISQLSMKLSNGSELKLDELESLGYSKFTVKTISYDKNTGIASAIEFNGIE